MSSLTAVSIEEAGLFTAGRAAGGRWRRTLVRFVRRQPLGSASAVVLVMLVVVAVCAPLIAPYSPTDTRVGGQLERPSQDHLFGTDNLGRDLFSRIVYGARISLYVGLTASIVGVTLATVLGSVSAYFSGVVDYVIQRIVDAAVAVPPIVLLMSVIVVLGRSITNMIIVLAFLQMLALSRVVRGAVISVRMLAYVESARAVGASHVRILIKHILLNIMPTVIVLLSIAVGTNILAEASLSFLGYGVPPPNPAWGSMISVDGRLYMLANPYLLIFPVLALSSVVFASNLFGDALRDELDPRLRAGR